MNTGIYKDLSNQAYRQSDAISKSQLDLIRKSPALFLWSVNAPYDEDKKEALDIGTAFHSLILEPDNFKNEFVVMPDDINRRTKEGKQAYEEFLNTSKEKIVLSAEDNKKLLLMRESLFSHPHAKWLIEAEGDPEISIFWNEETTGELAKCRPDKFLSEHSCIVDLKTTGDIERIEKSFFNYRYHVQDAWYTKEYETAYNDKLSSFIFLVVSTKLNCGRYPVRLFDLAQEVKELGKTEYLEDIATYHECKTSNDWAAIETIKLPYYME